MNAVYEEFRNNRDFYDGRRVAINPTVALSLGGVASLAYFSPKGSVEEGLANSEAFLNAARECFQMIGRHGSQRVQPCCMLRFKAKGNRPVVTAL